MRDSCEEGPDEDTAGRTLGRIRKSDWIALKCNRCLTVKPSGHRLRMYHESAVTAFRWTLLALSLLCITAADIPDSENPFMSETNAMVRRISRS